MGKESSLSAHFESEPTLYLTPSDAGCDYTLTTTGPELESKQQNNGFFFMLLYKHWHLLSSSWKVTLDGQRHWADTELQFKELSEIRRCEDLLNAAVHGLDVQTWDYAWDWVAAQWWRSCNKTFCEILPLSWCPVSRLKVWPVLELSWTNGSDSPKLTQKMVWATHTRHTHETAAVTLSVIPEDSAVRHDMKKRTNICSILNITGDNCNWDSDVCNRQNLVIEHRDVTWPSHHCGPDPCDQWLPPAFSRRCLVCCGVNTVQRRTPYPRIYQ